MKSYQTELDLNDRQRTACLKHAGAARFTYNWCLQRKKDPRMSGGLPKAPDSGRTLAVLTPHERGFTLV